MKACFTGHRPNKLEGGYDYYSSPNIALGRQIRKVCIELIEKHNVDTFICGGALGVDQMAFMVCNKLKEKYPNIKIVLAMPFEKQSANWINESKKLLEKHIELADEVVYVDELPKYTIKNLPIKEYNPAKMQKRNEYMVDNSDFVVAVWNGDTSGGTANCVRYAQSKNKEIIQIDTTKKQG